MNAFRRDDKIIAALSGSKNRESHPLNIRDSSEREVTEWIPIISSSCFWAFT